MLKRKRLVFVVALMLLIALSTLCFVACDNFGDNKSEKHITVYVGEKQFEVTTTRANLNDVLADLYRDEKITQYVVSGKGASAFIVQIDELVQNSTSGVYYSTWHSIDEFALKCVYQPTSAGYYPRRATATVEDGTTYVATTYQGTLLYYSGVGVGALPLRDGATYAILLD